MFKDDKICTELKYWKRYKAEEELYFRLKENPYWPFKQIGEGYFHVAFRSDRVTFGIWILIIAIIIFSVILIVLDYFQLAFAVFLILIWMGRWTLYGKFGWRELIICKRGKGKYMLRMFQNEEILFKNDIHNVYIRLVRKIDSLSDPHFYLILGGFGMDDLRMTRITKSEGPLRIMGMRIAYRIGINFFDWKDESEEHLIWHYKAFSRQMYTTNEVPEVLFKKVPSLSPTGGGSGASIDVPNLSPNKSLNNISDKTSPSPLSGGQKPLNSSSSPQIDDFSARRKVRISQHVKVRRMSNL